VNNRKHIINLKNKILIKKETKDIVKKDHNLFISTTSLGFIISGKILFYPLTFVGVTGLIYLVWPTWKQAYYDITQKKRFTRMVLEAIVLPGSILLGQYLIVAFAYSFLYFSLSKVTKAKGNMNKNLDNIFAQPSNRLVYVIRDNVEIELLLSDVQKNDILVVGAGETIPIDGTIIKGQSTIDQQQLTGEFKPIEKQVDD
jgi:cation transport ATPase